MRLIDADKFIKELNAGIFIYCQENTQDIIDAIQCQPTIERPQGKWICNPTYCYKCNQTNCGADMREEAKQ